MKHITKKSNKISYPKAPQVQASVHIRHDHRANNERHRLLEGILPPSSLSPHRPECSKQKSRKPHRSPIHVQRHKASYYSHPKSLNQRNLIPDTPKHHHVDAKMKQVRMAEAIQQVVPPRASLIESDMQEVTTDASHAQKYLSGETACRKSACDDTLFHTSCCK